MTKTTTQAEIRKDYIQDKYVIIASRREARPHDVGTTTETVPCRLCPARIDAEKAVYWVPEQGLWQIKVIPNKFPAVSLENFKAYGIQEVVIETPNHGVALQDIPEAQVMQLLRVYAARTKALSENHKIGYILIFKNSGGSAGASLKHAHSQLFATEFLPPHLADKSHKVQAYRKRTGRCVYCDVIGKEEGGPRLVYQDRYVVAFTPYASLHNYELWILPRRHLDNVTFLNDAERMSWAKILKYALKKIEALNLSYNFYFHQIIRDEDEHLYMKITPRGSIWAGVEIGSGLIINPVSPEDAAEYYRK